MKRCSRPAVQGLKYQQKRKLPLSQQPQRESSPISFPGIGLCSLTEADFSGQGRPCSNWLSPSPSGPPGARPGWASECNSRRRVMGPEGPPQTQEDVLNTWLVDQSPPVSRKGQESVDGFVPTSPVADNTPAGPGPAIPRSPVSYFHSKNSRLKAQP